MGDELFIWKMPAFDLPEEKVDEIMGKARKRKALLLDLRGNGGGREDTMLRLIGHFFDHDLKIGEIRSRKENRPLIAKSRGGQMFKGKLIVLIDSESASAAEVFARVVQLEKRGTVIGDQTAGSVMRSQVFVHQLGADRAIFYGVSITRDGPAHGRQEEFPRTYGNHSRRSSLADGESSCGGEEMICLAYAASLLGVAIDPQGWRAFPSAVEGIGRELWPLFN